jgi:RNA polymerase sigma-54 factor
MAMTPRLDLRQSQSLVMTPQLQQAIKLLQLSSVELAAYVDSELENNPMLEREESETPEDARGEEATDGPDNPGDAETFDGQEDTAPLEMATAENVSAGEDSALDFDESAWSEDGPTESPDSFETPYDGLGATLLNSGSAQRDPFDGERDFEATLSESQTLREKLVEQLVVEIEGHADRLIGICLIDTLDDSGWLTEPLDAIAANLNCPVERVEAVLEQLQRFEPAGLFARDLKECLALQLRDRDRLDPAMEAMLDNLALLARHDKSALMKACGVDAEDVADMVAEIRALDPKPAQVFQHEVAQTVAPDILMRPHPDGGWIIELNPETLPRVLVNNDYYARVRREVRDKDDRDYINSCFQSASWLVKSLHQRATTILKVAQEIVRQQDAFFRKGIAHMRPLVLRDIAEEIEMHESTVSRVTTNKYMHTPRGLFELKFFFSAAIGSLDGQAAHSAEAVRFRIKALIEDESSAKILSDDRIVEILNVEGIDIARRTVAKYRESMKIPSSVQRRRQKNQQI